MEVLSVPDQFAFPFPPYDIQSDFMKLLYEVIEKKKLGIFESPTGTGKSLSILCGAIRWLKDHNENQKKLLEKKIEKLSKEKEEIVDNSTDWISSQSKEIELNRLINELKIQQNRILDYEEKIEKLKNRKNALRKKWSKPELKNTDSLFEPKEENVEDDDILLDDCQNLESLSDDDDNDKENENRFRPTKIFICSRTHSQLSQFVGEILKSPYADQVRVSSLASRQNYCINPQVNRLKNMALINERCLDLQKQTKSQSTSDSDGKVVKRKRGSASCKCLYYKQTNIEELKDLVLTQVQDVEDLVKNGKALNACPYYASRLSAEDAEIVLVPYNTILHKATREANGIDLTDNIIIIDEAHNLLEAMAQMHNSNINYINIQQVLVQLKCYKQRFNLRFSAKTLLIINQIIFVASKLHQLFEKCNENKTETFNVDNFVLAAEIDQYNMLKLVKFCKDTRLAQKIRSYALKYPTDCENVKKEAKSGVKNFLNSIKNESSKAEQKTVEVEDKPQLLVTGNPMLVLISFLETLTYSYQDGRVFVHYNRDKNKCYLQFLLLNPSQNFVDIVQQARSVIVAGGTMKPYSEFKQRLFLNSGAKPERIVEFSCGHIIPPENVLPIILTQGPNNEKLVFNYEQRLKMGNCIKSVVLEACKCVRGGIVIFFPSYNYENWVWQNQIKNLTLNRQVFREPQDSGQVDNVLGKYAQAIKNSPKNGALLLSVVGGKLSEGLNFSDDLGRCIIVVGMPYANVTAADLKEKMNYLDKTEGAGAGKKFYENLCLKSVNQSIGRAVRHRNDYATIILLDERYNRGTTKMGLPDWIKRSLKVYNFDETFKNISKFFAEKKSDT